MSPHAGCAPLGARKAATAHTPWRSKQAWETAASGYSEAVTEFHIVGGLHPDLPLEYFLDLVSGLKERFPKVHIKAFTMVEVAFLARRAKLTIPETLERFKEAGVDSMPGGGAEIFADRVRHIICDHKIDGDEWLETARMVHQAGLKSNATMLYGHIENDEDRVDHLLKLRAVQDDTHGFQTFIPLAFHPDNTPLAHLPRTTGLTDIKQIAVSRLLLDNFPHIKAYWQMMTAKIAQIALRFGADDIDGTVIEEKIYHDAGATTPQGMRRQELMRLITRRWARSRSSATRFIAQSCEAKTHLRRCLVVLASRCSAHDNGWPFRWRRRLRGELVAPVLSSSRACSRSARRFRTSFAATSTSATKRNRQQR